MITTEQLHHSEKYNVHLGTGAAGFCTVWNEPKAVLRQAPRLLEKAAIVGTLYSAQGVNVIIRNLALNPHIRRLYMWGHGHLSQTKFGIMGIGIFRKLWAEGPRPDGSVPGTSFRLEREIDLNILQRMRQHVELIDVSAADLDGAMATMATTATEPYMKPVRFPDAVPATPDMFPSEQVGWLIRGHGIIEAWLRVVERVMRYGAVKGTQYGSQQKELIGVTWVARDENPTSIRLPTDWPRELREVTGATEDAIREYHDVFLSADKPPGVSYTYGNRLQRYPRPDGGTMDQIVESVIRNLRASPDTRRAVATTLVPWIDAASDEPPCITQVQAIQSHGALHFLVTVRSHDIFKAAIPNAFGLRMLQGRIAGETGFTLGALQITSQSAHIYEADWENAKKLAACAFWEAPVRPFQAEDADGRGMFLIRVQRGKILVEFQGTDGAPLLSFEGTSADRLVRELSKHDLMSQTSHALDIGVQLARAEVALNKGLPFTQDRPVGE